MYLSGTDFKFWWIAALDKTRVECVLQAFQLPPRPEHLASNAGLYNGDVDRYYVYCVPTFLWSSALRIAGPVFVDLALVLATATAETLSENIWTRVFIRTTGTLSISFSVRSRARLDDCDGMSSVVAGSVVTAVAGLYGKCGLPPVLVICRLGISFVGNKHGTPHP